MLTSRQYLDRVRQHTTTGSDYAVAALLGISEAAVNKYRKGHRIMDNDTCRRIADVTGIDLEAIIATCEIERAKNPETKRAWESRIKRMGQRAAVALTAYIAATALPANDGNAMASTKNSEQAVALASAPGQARHDETINYAHHRRSAWSALRALTRLARYLLHPQAQTGPLRGPAPLARNPAT